MDVGAKPSADVKKLQGLTAPPRGHVMSDSVTSYTEYPAGRPFINTPLPLTHRPVKAFPESNSAAILSALKNLQEKIRRLELERRDPHQKLQTEKQTHNSAEEELDNHAETRCSRLERHLEHMRKNVRTTESDRTAVLRRQATLERLGSGQQEVVHRKLDALEQEYQRLTDTQTLAEKKIRELERKLQEEEHQRKLVQDKARQLQTGLEANRVLIQSVSPRPRDSSKVKQKKKHACHSQPHYRLSLGDVPFVSGTSTSSSHSVRANVQRVLHLLKQHHPQLCNERVLGHAHPSGSTNERSRGSSSSSASSGCDELSDLLLTLQDEFGHMSFEQQELATRIESCRWDGLRQDLEREMETLVRRMESKGEQIAKVRRHQTQLERLKKQEDEMKVWSSCRSRSRSSAVVQSRPGERSRDSLRLLKDMRSLQTSLRRHQLDCDF